MILFFNWENLLKVFNYNPFKVVSNLRTFKEDGLMGAGIKPKIKMGGSFLLNPDSLFRDTETDILYIHQYLNLAAKRDYSLYKLYGIKSLPLSYYPDIKLESIKHNPLLTVTKTDIHFKYEELTNGTKIR